MGPKTSQMGRGASTHGPSPKRASGANVARLRTHLDVTSGIGGFALAAEAA